MKVTVLPEATREQMLDAAGLDGSARWSDAEAGNQRAPHDPEVEDFLLGDGWSIASLEGGRQAGGMTTHRGALHPDEYEALDHDIVREKVEALLGFTYAEVSAVYDITGRPTADQTQKRSQIDSALLGLSRSGGNMLALARVFGWPIKGGDGNGGESCDKMERAIARAERAEG